jgi:hypothetical protein
MTMTKPDHKNERAVDAAFASLRANPPRPSSELFDKVLARALAEQPVLEGARVCAEAEALPGFWAEVLGIFGGWRGAGGLTTAMVVGLVIGLSGTVQLPIYEATDEVLDLMPGGTEIFAEINVENENG